METQLKSKNKNIESKQNELNIKIIIYTIKKEYKQKDKANTDLENNGMKVDDNGNITKTNDIGQEVIIQHPDETALIQNRAKADNVLTEKNITIEVDDSGNKIFKKDGQTLTETEINDIPEIKAKIEADALLEKRNITFNKDGTPSKNGKKFIEPTPEELPYVKNKIDADAELIKYDPKANCKNR